jgi:hypothetical protein
MGKSLGLAVSVLVLSVLANALFWQVGPWAGAILFLFAAASLSFAFKKNRQGLVKTFRK